MRGIRGFRRVRLGGIHRISFQPRTIYSFFAKVKRCFVSHLCRCEYLSIFDSDQVVNKNMV